jgi:hypothetical protein
MPRPRPTPRCPLRRPSRGPARAACPCPSPAPTPRRRARRPRRRAARQRGKPSRSSAEDARAKQERVAGRWLMLIRGRRVRAKQRQRGVVERSGTGRGDFYSEVSRVGSRALGLLRRDTLGGRARARPEEVARREGVSARESRSHPCSISNHTTYLGSVR